MKIARLKEDPYEYMEVTKSIEACFSKTNRYVVWGRGSLTLKPSTFRL